MASKICGTCKYCMYKMRKGGEIPRDGYCYGMPPLQGGIRPKTGLHHNACSIYAQKTDQDDNVLKHGEQ